MPFYRGKWRREKPIIRVELFHRTMSVLTHATLALNLLGGISLEQAKKLADSLNENVWTLLSNCRVSIPCWCQVRLMAPHLKATPPPNLDEFAPRGLTRKLQTRKFAG
jgi:hypothetical protein